MKDIQSEPDVRGINIQKVGVKNISYPVTVLDKANRVQQTVAAINMYVNLPHQFKGTHMSRFVEILNRFHGSIDRRSFHAILLEMKECLEARDAHLDIVFPYFLQKAGDKNRNCVRYDCRMHGALGERDHFSLEITLPIAAFIPAQGDTKSTQSFGRWGKAEIRVTLHHFLWIEEIIQLAEEVLLARRQQTAAIHSNADFLTPAGISKALAGVFAQHPAIQSFQILVEHLAEGYDTFAEVDWPSVNDTFGMDHQCDGVEYERPFY